MFLFKFILIVIQMVKNFDGTKIIRQETKNADNFLAQDMIYYKTQVNVTLK